MTWLVESETAEQRVESCDHEGTTEALNGSASISVCTECGKTWPTAFRVGAPTVRVIEKQSDRRY
jgi:hypothetical protein